MVNMQAWANGILFVRNTVPFGVVAALAMVGRFHIDELLVLWALGGLVAASLGLRVISAVMVGARSTE